MRVSQTILFHYPSGSFIPFPGFQSKTSTDPVPFRSSEFPAAWNVNVILGSDKGKEGRKHGWSG